MANSRLLILIIVSFSLILFEISYFDKETSTTSSKNEILASKQTRNPQSTAKNDQKADTITDHQEKSDQIQNESSQIGLIDEHPEQTEKKLIELAHTLQLKDLTELKFKTLNANLNGDDRMLSVYLLSLSQHEKTALMLEEIAIAPIKISKEEYRQYEFENVIRSQAIEGLQNRENKEQAIKSLNRLVTKLSDSFLLDRSQRALSHHKYQTQKIENQDRDALKKIVQ